MSYIRSLAFVLFPHIIYVYILRSVECRRGRARARTNLSSLLGPVLATQTLYHIVSVCWHFSLESFSVILWHFQQFLRDSGKQQCFSHSIHQKKKKRKKKTNINVLFCFCYCSFSDWITTRRKCGVAKCACYVKAHAQKHRYTQFID